jgi:hypothetical protein
MISVCSNGHLKTPENVDKRNRCKICYHTSHKIWRAKNKDKKNQDSKEYYYNNKEKVKEVIERSRLKRQYGITVDDYNEMVINQNNVCAICGKEETEKNNKLSIDHDHETGMVRNLLCHKCNRGLGSFNDDIEILKNAVAYLSKHKQSKEKEI